MCNTHGTDAIDDAFTTRPCYVRCVLRIELQVFEQMCDTCSRNIEYVFNWKDFISISCGRDQQSLPQHSSNIGPNIDHSEFHPICNAGPWRRSSCHLRCVYGCLFMFRTRPRLLVHHHRPNERREPHTHGAYFWDARHVIFKKRGRPATSTASAQSDISR